MKVTIVTQPSGLINGQPWPEPGEEIDLPDEVAQDAVSGGWAKKAERKAPAKKAAEPKVEKRPASKKGEEKR